MKKFNKLIESVYADVMSSDESSNITLDLQTIQNRIFQTLESFNLELGKEYIWKADALATQMGIDVDDFIRCGIEPNDFMMNYVANFPADSESMFKCTKTSVTDVNIQNEV